MHILGYQDGVKRYRLWDPKESELVISRDVTFDEITQDQRRIMIIRFKFMVASKKVELEIETHNEDVEATKHEYTLGQRDKSDHLKGLRNLLFLHSTW